MSAYIFVILGFAFLSGAVIGSFLNVVALRFLKEESIVSPSSYCPSCNKPIAPRDNIPILSYLMLKGQCRYCKSTISIQYPIVEIMTGLLFTWTVWQFGLSLQTLFLLFLLINLVVITITDFKESVIFQVNSLSLIPVGLIYSLFNLGHLPTEHTLIPLGLFTISIPFTFYSALLGILVAFVLFEGLIFLSQAVFGTEGFGHGDTHLMMGVGAYLGWQLTVLALLLGFIIQLIPAIPMMIIEWIRQKNYVSLFSGLFAFLFALLPMGLMNLPIPLFLKNSIMLLSMLCSIIALLVFLRRIKETQSYTYMPLGPSLILGSLVALFFGNQVIEYYTLLTQLSK